MSVVQRKAMITAAPEAVWAFLADGENWSQWEPDIVKVLAIEGGLQDGGSLRVRMKPGMKATVVFAEVSAPRRFVCRTTLSAGLIVARGVFELAPVQDGAATDLTYTFSMGGPLGVLMRTFNPKKLVKGTETGLSNLVRLAAASAG